jgi:class 3 adenylate cyclase
VISVRESFGAKLLAALLGTVGLLLTITLLAVRIETSREVGIVTDRTIQRAGTLFEELNELQREQAAGLARPFTEGQRARVLLLEAMRTDDIEWIADQAEYQLQLQAPADINDALIVLTDDLGRPVLSMIAGERITDGDPADILPLAGSLLQPEATADEAMGYRVVDGRLYNVHSLYIELGFRPIGTITFGLPIEPEQVARIGSVGNFEACFFADGECVVSTPGVTPEVEGVLRTAVERPEGFRTRVEGGEWWIQHEPLLPERPEEGSRIIGVPLDQVIDPFANIQLTLLLSGAGALALSALVGAVLSRSLTRPIKDLVVAAGRVAEGHYEAEVRVDSRDEMRTLADAFNDMTRGLLLRERYRSVLNKVVSTDVAEELLKGDVDLGGENREVSVLFADIRGFTPMTQGMEPQEVISVLNDCMEHLSRAVDAEGGVVDKFIGDEIMAVFGAPVEQPDHASRAVRAAVRMQDGMLEMNARREARGDAPIGLGIGVASGIAVAGNMGSPDRLNYTVLGETVNLAARLTDHAKAGEILASGRTVARAGPAVVSTGAGDLALKGFAADVEVARVEAFRG